MAPIYEVILFVGLAVIALPHYQVVRLKGHSPLRVIKGDLDYIQMRVLLPNPVLLVPLVPIVVVS